MNHRLKIFLLLACMIAAVASTVYALPTGGRDITYYSDDTFSEAVGGQYLACGSGQWDVWGERTNYSIAETWDCASGETIDCSVYLCNGYRWYDQYGGEHWEEGSCTRIGCNDW
jgi:hypothetical protein